MYRKKTYPRKKRTYRKRYTRSGLNKTEKKQVRAIAKRVDNSMKDVKFSYYEFTTTISDNWTGPDAAVGWPAQTVQGFGNIADLMNTQSGRIGNSINLKSFDFSYTLYAGDSVNNVRVIIFQWLLDNTTVPTVGDIVIGTGGAYDWLKPINYEYRRNFRILYDQVHGLSTNAGNNNTITRKLKFYGKRLPVKKITFETNTAQGFSASIIKGALYYMLVSDSAVATHPRIEMNGFMRFTDE